jgi:hypothetical protein
MKQWLIVISLLVYPLCSNANEPSEFRYYSEISGPFQKGILYIAELPDSVLGKCALRCSDLRIFTSEGQEVPYLIVENRQEDIFKEYPLEIEHFQEKKDSVVLTLNRKDLVNTPSSIEFDISSRNFLKKAFIDGRSKDKEWEPIGEDYLFDFSSQLDHRNTSLKIINSPHDTYRVRIEDVKAEKQTESIFRFTHGDMELTALPLQINGSLRFDKVTARYKSSSTVQRMYDRLDIPDYITKKDDEEETIIEFQTSIPFNKIFVFADNPSYNRTVRLSGSKDTNAKELRHITSGSISSFAVAEKENKNYLETPGALYKHYRLEISNNKRQPLSISKIEIEHPRKYLAFMGISSSGAYTLKLGNNSMEYIKYDISDFINSKNLFTFEHKQVELAKLNVQEGYKEQTRTLTEKNVLVVVILFLMALLALWLYRLLSGEKGRIKN